VRFNENEKGTTSKGTTQTAGDRARKLSRIRTFIIVDRNICDIYLERLGYIALYDQCKFGGPSRVGRLKELENRSWTKIGQLSG
jgi:hypothetical protein